MREPSDLYLTRTETQRTVAEHLFAQARTTGEFIESIQQRMAGAAGETNFLDVLSSMLVTREKYAGRYEHQPSAGRVDGANERLRSVPDTVRQAIASSSVVEGEAVHQMREWQSLSGDKSRGLLLLGPAGGGKTLHACMLLLGNSLETEPDGFFLGESVLAMRLGMRVAKEREQAVAPLRAASLVVVDYMGQRKPFTGWEAAVIEFLRLRWEAGRRCVLTFRGDVEAFQRVYSADGWATVERFCTVLTVRRGS